MEQFKRAQVVMLPTESGENFPILQNINGRGNQLYEPTKGYYYTKSFLNIQKFQPQHLYIISNDEIEEGNFILTFTHAYGYKIDQIKEIHKGTYVSVRNELLSEELIKGKIIATTDTSLKVSNRPNSDHPYNLQLPQPSQQFIERYIEDYNKGNIITDVLVEYESSKVIVLDANSREMWDFVDKLKIKPKDNTIIITRVKDSWNRGELDDILEHYRHFVWTNGCTRQDLIKWKQENL